MGEQPSDPTPASAYPLGSVEAETARATFAVIVDNAPGVLHRIVGVFAARGYNVDSLTVAETDHVAHASRITIVTRGAPQKLEQIQAQLERMVQTRQVRNLVGDPQAVERELALVKVRGTGTDRVEALRVAEIFRARVIDTSLDAFVFEVTGAPNKIDNFEALMRPIGLVEVSRTGVLSIRRGSHRD